MLRFGIGELGGLGAGSSFGAGYVSPLRELP